MTAADKKKLVLAVSELLNDEALYNVLHDNDNMYPKIKDGQLSGMFSVLAKTLPDYNYVLSWPCGNFQCLYLQEKISDILNRPIDYDNLCLQWHAHRRYYVFLTCSPEEFEMVRLLLDVTVWHCYYQHLKEKLVENV